MISSLRIFLIWGLIVLIAFITFSACLARITVGKEVEKAEKWFPNYSATNFAKNNLLLGKKLSPEMAKQIRANAIDGLRLAPLSDLPFVHMGIANYSLREGSNNRDLIDEALNRNTRNRLALRTLVNIDGLRKNYTEAIKNLDILLKLKGSKTVTDEYQQALLTLSEIPTALPIIEKYLKSRPVWGKRFLFNKIGKMTEKNHVAIGRLIQIYTEKTNVEMDKNIHKNYLSGLQRINKGDAAYDYWYSLIKPPKPILPYTVYNPEFDQRDELPPFNWRQVQMPKFFSEIDQSGGLYASFADNINRELSEQILKLVPGQAYGLEVKAEWTYRRRQGAFSWVLSCVGNSTELAIVNLDEVTKETSGGRSEFRVPSDGCEAQSLTLIANPGQYSQRIWSRTNSVNIFAVR